MKWQIHLTIWLTENLGMLGTLVNKFKLQDISFIKFKKIMRIFTWIFFFLIIIFFFFCLANVEGGPRSPEIAFEDEFIRRFMTGTWHNIFLSELCIKRNHNVVRIVGIIKQNLGARKLYFLIGYTQELLSYWLQCPVKLELQSVTNPEDVIFKYI